MIMACRSSSTLRSHGMTLGIQARGNRIQIQGDVQVQVEDGIQSQPSYDDGRSSVFWRSLGSPTYMKSSAVRSTWTACSGGTTRHRLRRPPSTGTPTPLHRCHARRICPIQRLVYRFTKTHTCGWTDAPDIRFTETHTCGWTHPMYRESSGGTTPRIGLHPRRRVIAVVHHRTTSDSTSP